MLRFVAKLILWITVFCAIIGTSFAIHPSHQKANVWIAETPRLQRTLMSGKDFKPEDVIMAVKL